MSAQSVSRVGGKAQRAAYRAVAGDLKLAYAQFEELETFARFGARLDEGTRQSIAHGKRIRACLGQSELSPVSVPAQIAILLALNAALFDAVPLDRMAAAQRAVRGRCQRAARRPVGERLDAADQAERRRSRAGHRSRPSGTCTVPGARRQSNPPGSPQPQAAQR